MEIDEIINIINFKQLNLKTNNCIITDVDDNSKKYLLDNIKKQSLIINSKDVYEENLNIEYLINIIINLESIDYFNILNFALEQLNITERVKLESIRDLLKFKSILMKNKKAIQFIIIKPSILDAESAKIFNLLLWINTFLFNSIILLNETEQLSSYQMPNGRLLDSREDYMKIKLVKYDKKS